MQVDEGERNADDAGKRLLNKIATLTGGRAAEELIFGSITTGASNDIEQATKLARAMITRYGMSRKLRHGGARDRHEPVSWAATPPLPARLRPPRKIDEEVIATVKAAHEKAIKILQDNMDVLHRLAHHLLEKETITGDEFMSML